MPDEHESAAAAWLDDVSAQREIGVVRKRFPAWRESDVYLFAIMLEILTALDFYGEPELPPDDDPEPWRREAA